MADESEEKTEPASDKKLRDARRKGQVPHSKDLVSGAVFLAGTGYLLGSWSGLDDQLRQLIDVVGAAPTRPFDEVSGRVTELVGHVLLTAIVSLAGVTMVAALASGMAATLGPVFAFEALQPKLENISPMKGLKRIVSLRSLIEIAKSLIKIVVIAPIFWIILRGAINPLIEAPACGTACFAPILFATVKMLTVTAAVVFVVVGLVDLLIQRHLFLREMRMSHTEVKREYKDMEGDPHLRGEQRRLRRELASPKVRLGMRNAVLAVIHHGHFVGLRYKRGETSVPCVACKGRGDVAARMLAEARRRAIPIVEDGALAGALFGHAVGHPIRRELFDPVARILIDTGIGKAE
jgi:type III secretion protein U